MLPVFAASGAEPRTGWRVPQLLRAGSDSWRGLDFDLRGQNRVTELVSAIPADMRLHTVLPLFALGGLMHIGISLATAGLRRDHICVSSAPTAAHSR